MPVVHDLQALRYVQLDGTVIEDSLLLEGIVERLQRAPPNDLVQKLRRGDFRFMRNEMLAAAHTAGMRS